MGIVLNQTFKNTITTYLGFGIGAINILFLFTNFLTDEYHGLVAFILSSANIMMPLFALGSNNTLIKFYTRFNTENDINSFLTFMLFVPLIFIIPIGFIGWLSYDWISELLSHKNPIIHNYVWLIYIAAICFAYFEIFYAWTKVQMQSVFGNIMKELFHRIAILVLFLLIYFNLFSVDYFIYAVVAIYLCRTLIMMLYAFYLRRPKISFDVIPQFPSIIKYALLIVLAGSIGGVILEIDKFMIGEINAIENVAYYGVAIYMASVISVPVRSMHQITNPITAKLLNDKDTTGLRDLYQKSSLNLFIVSGLIFVLIVLNLNQLYDMIPSEFRNGFFVVFIVGIAKLTDNVSGTNNAILFNSEHYGHALILGIITAIMVVVLNLILIPSYGIDGAAVASFIAIIIYNISKLTLVFVKFKILPFTYNSLKTLGLIVVIILLFYFWDFTLNPIINIVLKSSLIICSYLYTVYKLKLSLDISHIFDKLLRF